MDALIGLIPGAGDLVSGGLGLLVVVRAAQRGLPTIVLARMLVNVALDFAIGAIPIIGDIFDMCIQVERPQRRPDAPLRDQPNASTTGQWLFFGGILATVGAGRLRLRLADLDAAGSDLQLTP